MNVSNNSVNIAEINNGELRLHTRACYIYVFFFFYVLFYENLIPSTGLERI